MGTLTICFFIEIKSLEKSSNLPKATQIRWFVWFRAQYLNTMLCSLLLGYTVPNTYFPFPNKLLFQLPRFTLSLASLPMRFLVHGESKTWPHLQGVYSLSVGTVPTSSFEIKPSLKDYFMFLLHWAFFHPRNVTEVWGKWEKTIDYWKAFQKQQIFNNL